MNKTTVPDVLARIVAHKEMELTDLRARLNDLERSVRPATRGFKQALVVKPPSIIAEVKKASPSKGLLSADFDPSRIGSLYEQGGAAAISVLTDQKFFQGSLADLEVVRNTVAVPVLRKDFTLCEEHVIEAAAHGADAILLIAAILSTEQMRRLRELATSFGMDSLVEVHDDQELARALDSGPEIVGVNNRDLRTFDVRLETSLLLAEKMPGDVVLVSESGIHQRADVERLQAAGYQAFLVGEHLMKSSDPVTALRDLISSR